MAPTMLTVAHGGRQRETQRCVHAVAEQVRSAEPGVEVRVAFLQHGRPSLGHALAQAGPDAVVVPLLLSPGYHLSADVGGIAAVAGVPVAAPLGPDLQLADALADRLASAGAPPGCPVVMAAAGSRDRRAAVHARRQAGLLAARWGGPVATAYASACRPGVAEAVSALRARTREPVAVAAYLLSPGFFHDRLAASGADWISSPLAGHPAVASLVWQRFRAACR